MRSIMEGNQGSNIQCGFATKAVNLSNKYIATLLVKPKYQ